MPLHVRSAAEHELFRGADIALNSSIDLRDSDIDHGLCNLRAGADDKRSILRRHISGEVAVDTQHRFEAHFARKIHNIADKAEPIILIDIGPLTINWSSHCVASGESGRKENYLARDNISSAS